MCGAMWGLVITAAILIGALVVDGMQIQALEDVCAGLISETDAAFHLNRRARLLVVLAASASLLAILNAPWWAGLIAIVVAVTHVGAFLSGTLHVNAHRLRGSDQRDRHTQLTVAAGALQGALLLAVTSAIILEAILSATHLTLRTLSPMWMSLPLDLRFLAGL